MKGKAAERLRIAFFNASDRGSGAEALTVKTVEKLIAQGIDARLYAMRCETRAPFVYQFPVFRGERRIERKFRGVTGRNDFLFPSTFVLGSCPWIKDADIWHFHNLHGHYISIPLLAAQSRKRPVVLSPVDQFLSTGYCPYTLGCERYRDACGDCPQLDLPYPGISRDATRPLLAMKKSAVGKSKFYILVHTDYLAQHYASTFVGSRPIERIYYGVDTQVFRPMDRDTCAAALRVQPTRRFVIGLFHSFVEEKRKGLLPLLSLLQSVADRMHGSIEVFVVGHASERAREYATPTMPVTAVPFLQSENELAMALNLCNVLLYPTQAENLSLTCLDALACGVPVVSSNIGGQSEAIQNEVNGFLCEPNRNDQIIECTARLAADKNLTQQLSIGARQTVVSQFDINTYITNLVGYYERVLQRGTNT